ncbi:hypothetical protein EXN66_Car003350 [Channa argus]|uniref:Uncharacterized protein n=1 Tax=Channa argus TaxID=215402 RepID=A0A6G1PCB8_CHAAH|nr:hypothetical protein EXN66_Car003350 [Channa argus]
MCMCKCDQLSTEINILDESRIIVINNSAGKCLRMTSPGGTFSSDCVILLLTL